SPHAMRRRTSLVARRRQGRLPRHGIDVLGAAPRFSADGDDNHAHPTGRPLERRPERAHLRLVAERPAHRPPLRSLWLPPRRRRPSNRQAATASRRRECRDRRQLVTKLATAPGHRGITNRAELRPTLAPPSVRLEAATHL